MVLKQERRVNAASVAKRQSISAAGAQKKLEIEEAAREVDLQKAWSVGAAERTRSRRFATPSAPQRMAPGGSRSTGAIAGVLFASAAFGV